jgi:hypothetical protein
VAEGEGDEVVGEEPEWREGEGEEEGLGEGEMRRWWCAFRTVARAQEEFLRVRDGGLS